MLRSMLKAKIHDARVTEADLNYQGSITIDQTLIEAAGILPYEKVQVLDIDNGSRLETYAIEGAAGSRVICMNGAAARLVHPGDKVIILTYHDVPEEETRNYHPIVINVDEKNNIVDPILKDLAL